VEFKAAVALAGGNDGLIQEAVTTCAGTIGPKQAIELLGDRLETNYRWRLLGTELAIRAGDNALAQRLIQINLDQESILPPQDRLQVHAQASSFFLGTTPQQLDKALASMEKMVELRGKDKQSLNNIAYVLILQGGSDKLKRAIGYAEEAYNMAKANRFNDPGDDSILDTYGWSLVLSGMADGNSERVDNGIQILQEAIAIGNIPEPHFHLGEAYIYKKLKDNAIFSLNNALDRVRAREQNSQQVDPALRGRIEDALRRAQELNP
jgi:tetratricopeptide (TPR) repeat protein